MLSFSNIIHILLNVGAKIDRIFESAKLFFDIFHILISIDKDIARNDTEMGCDGGFSETNEPNCN
jgi:hypothetical protein